MRRVCGLLMLLLLTGCGGVFSPSQDRLAWRSAGRLSTPDEPAPAPPQTAAAEEVAQEEADAAAEPLPADPVEVGRHSLFLSLTDEETGDAVSGTVQLWRLGLPESEHWTRGDLRQASLKIPPEGGRFEGLPEGRYRIFFEGERAGAEDPAEFTLTSPRTALHFALPMPRRHGARFSVFDEHGLLLTHALRSDGGTGRGWMETRPSWAERRLPRGGGGFGGRGGSRSCGGSRRAALPVTADRDGFYLGEFEENSRAASYTSSHTFTFEERTDAYLYFRRVAPGPWEYVALSVPVAPIRDSIRVAGGALPPAAFFQARCEAVLAGTADVHSLPIKVRVTLKGYEDLEFEWHVGDPLPFRELAVAVPSVE